MKSKLTTPLAGIGLIFALYSQTASAGLLGTTAETFAILAGAAITSTGATTIIGNVGSAPTNTVTGFPPATISGGILTSLPVTAQAQADALIAYNFLSGQTPTQI